LDFKNLEESVRKMSEKMKLKHEVLDILEAPTKIHIRSEEQKLQDGRGRPRIDLQETYKETEQKKMKVKEIEDKRN